MACRALIGLSNVQVAVMGTIRLIAYCSPMCRSFRSGFPSFPDMIQLGSKLLSPIFGGLFNKN